MNIEDLRLIVIECREELQRRLDRIIANSNRVKKAIENEEEAIQELTREFTGVKNQITTVNRNISLANGIAERIRLRNELARLRITSRNIRQRLNTRRVVNQRNEEADEKLDNSIVVARKNISAYIRIIRNIGEINDRELLECIINLFIRYQEHPEILEIFKRIIVFIDFRIREHVDSQINILRENPLEDLTILDDVIEKYNNHLATLNIPIEFLKIILRFLGGITKIRDPSIEQGLEIIENYKQQNPNWWFDDYKTVLRMYQPLRKRIGRIAQELEDLELILNSMVDEIHNWNRENKGNWVLKRTKDMEELINDYIQIYPQISVFFNPINHHRLVNE